MPTKHSQDETLTSLPRPHKRGRRIAALLDSRQQAQGARASTAATSGSPLDMRARGLTGAPNVHSTQPQSPSCLLGVLGLTRQALDDCVDAYFAVINRLSHPRSLFLRRVRVLLYDVAGLEVPRDLDDIQAASELLTLAVACAGVPFSKPHRHLADPLRARCVALSAEADDLDGIEALSILATGEDPKPQTHPLALDLLGRGPMVDLALFHKVNVQSDDSRRQTLFWTIWESDAIHSASAGISCRISESNMGWPMTGLLDTPGQRLAAVCRRICPIMFSARVTVRGRSDQDAQKVLDALDGLHLDLDPSSSFQNCLLTSTHNWVYLVAWAAVAGGDRQLSPAAIATLDAAAVRASSAMLPLATTAAANRGRPRAVRDQLAGFVIFLARAHSGDSDCTILAKTLCQGVAGFEETCPNSTALAQVLSHDLHLDLVLSPSENANGAAGGGAAAAANPAALALGTDKGSSGVPPPLISLSTGLDLPGSSAGQVGSGGVPGAAAATERAAAAASDRYTGPHTGVSATPAAPRPAVSGQDLREHLASLGVNLPRGLFL